MLRSIVVGIASMRARGGYEVRRSDCACLNSCNPGTCNGQAQPSVSGTYTDQILTQELSPLVHTPEIAAS